MKALSSAIILLPAFILCLSCGAPPPLTESALADYRAVAKARSDSLRSAAYLIDLRVNNAGEKFSVMTELVFSGDSVGLYGRGYLGRGAFKGNIIGDTVRLYFAAEDEYFMTTLTHLDSAGDCARGGEALLSALSFLSGRKSGRVGRDSLQIAGSWATYRAGRFSGRLRLNKQGVPRSEVLVDALCHDSMTITYGLFNDKFPYYQPFEFEYRNGRDDFQAKGFMREQKYNAAIPAKKLQITIPSTARRLELL
jgi:hypothetical protein